jgi:hypothetical protein
LLIYQLDRVMLACIHAGAAIKAFIRIKNYNILSFQRPCRAGLHAPFALCPFHAPAAYALPILPTALLIINLNHDLFLSHLLHNSGSFSDGLTPKIPQAITRYRNPSSGTLHFLHFLFAIIHLFQLETRHLEKRPQF